MLVKLIRRINIIDGAIDFIFNILLIFQPRNTAAGSTLLIVLMEKKRELPTEINTVTRKRTAYSMVE
jgi:hypothetical protein